MQREQDTNQVRLQGLPHLRQGYFQGVCFALEGNKPEHGAEFIGGVGVQRNQIHSTNLGIVEREVHFGHHIQKEGAIHPQAEELERGAEGRVLADPHPGDLPKEFQTPPQHAPANSQVGR